MLTAGEQQELHQIEEDLRDTDRGFAWRLTLLEGILGWAGPGRQAYLLVLAVLAVALLWLVAAAGRLLMAFAEGALRMGSATVMALGDAAWPGWQSGKSLVTVAARCGTGRSLTARTCHEHAGKHGRLGARVPPGRPR